MQPQPPTPPTNPAWRKLRALLLAFFFCLSFALVACEDIDIPLPGTTGEDGGAADTGADDTDGEDGAEDGADGTDGGEDGTDGGGVPDPFDESEFGPNVVIFDAEMAVEDIKAELDATFEQQVDDEMGSNRYAYFFKPGSYGDADAPLQFNVGYYTQVSGLGESPEDVEVEGKIEVYNRCLTEGGTANCIALNNFWRTLSNLSLEVNGAGQDGCRATGNFWAVSQAVSVRRVDVTGGNLVLMDYCTAGPQFASGGFIADTRVNDTFQDAEGNSVDNVILNGSQQQWLIRNSTINEWTNGVWNQVFSGVEGAPVANNFPYTNAPEGDVVRGEDGNPLLTPYTTLAETPLSREKPYMYIDDTGNYQVRVPAAQRNTSGVSWAEQTTFGRNIPIQDFFIAQPDASVADINAALAEGKNLLLTPGLYEISESIRVENEDTVVLGIGHATLRAVNGATPLKVAGESGIVIAGVTIDAGEVLSDVLLQVGENGSTPEASNPLTLSDVYFRIGGPYVGKTKLALEVNADNVLIDHTWVWRADHGIEGFTAGVLGDTDRWNTNIGTVGAIINGDNVTATGLFVEHFQTFNTVWNGENGTVILYQNELPYDPPTQADWMKGDNLGYPGYQVGQDVKNHKLFGGGVYVFNQNNPDIVTRNGFQVPDAPGVELNNILTVNLTAGTVENVINGRGESVTSEAAGVPSYIVKYSDGLATFPPLVAPAPAPVPEPDPQPED